MKTLAEALAHNSNLALGLAPEAKSLTDRQKELLALFERQNFGFRTSSVIDLVETLANEKIKHLMPTSEDYALPAGALFKRDDGVHISITGEHPSFFYSRSLSEITGGTIRRCSKPSAPLTAADLAGFDLSADGLTYEAMLENIGAVADADKNRATRLYEELPVKNQTSTAILALEAATGEKVMNNLSPLSVGKYVKLSGRHSPDALYEIIMAPDSDNDIRVAVAGAGALGGGHSFLHRNDIWFVDVDEYVTPATLEDIQKFWGVTEAEAQQQREAA
tara:strand:+ start:227 stop:1057 length:831 start_codon:yes stop_codon:yes gene_type:complete